MHASRCLGPVRRCKKSWTDESIDLLFLFKDRICPQNILILQIEAPVYANLVSSFEYLEICNRKILNYGWVNFPLAYTQVATLSVYAYLTASLFASQFLSPSNSDMLDNETFPHVNITFSTKSPFDMHTPDVKVPWFTIIEFISYMGWIKGEFF